jgi:feruloyl esterase
MFGHVPTRPEPALVVVLHGCTQTAASYDVAGWSTLADRYGFVLLLPQQQPLKQSEQVLQLVSRRSHRARERRGAVDPADGRGDGARSWIDRRRVFITGSFSRRRHDLRHAATYPETFAAGAVIAGLGLSHGDEPPRGVRKHVQGAPRPAREWGDFVRAASAHRGRGRAYRYGTATPTRW